VLATIRKAGDSALDVEVVLSNQLKTTDSPHFLVLFCLPDAEDGQWAIARQWMPDQRDEAETHASGLIQCLPNGSQVVIA
jgi:hypothetical protein